MRLKPLLAGLATFMPGLSRVALRPTGGTDSVRYSYSVWLRHLVLARRHGLDAFPHAVGPSWGRATPSARASRPSSRERRPTSPSTPSNTPPRSGTWRSSTSSWSSSARGSRSPERGSCPACALSVRGRRPYCLNREPHSRHLAGLLEAGFEVTAGLVIRDRPSSGLPPAARFRGLSADDRSARNAFIIARKPAGPRREGPRPQPEPP